MANQKSSLPRQGFVGSLLGRVAQAPEIRQDVNQNPYTRFDVAVNSRNGADFHTIFAFGEEATNIGEQVSKGDLVDFSVQIRQQYGFEGQPVMATMDNADPNSDEPGPRIKTYLNIVQGFEVVAKRLTEEERAALIPSAAATSLGDVLASAGIVSASEEV